MLKVHLAGFSLSLNFINLPNSFVRLTKVFFKYKFDYHIVDINIDFFVHHVVKKSHHCLLIRCLDIFKPERHRLLTKGSPKCDEGDFFNFFGCHLDLIVLENQSMNENSEEIVDLPKYQYAVAKNHPFCTGTMFATFKGILLLPKNPTLNCLCTSSFIFKDTSSFILLNICLIRGHSGLSGNLCYTMSRSNLGIS